MGLRGSHIGQHYTKRTYISERPITINRDRRNNGLNIYTTTGGLHDPRKRIPKPEYIRLEDRLKTHITNRGKSTWEDQTCHGSEQSTVCVGTYLTALSN